VLKPCRQVNLQASSIASYAVLSLKDRGTVSFMPFDLFFAKMNKQPALKFISARVAF
jgi:hypothetical protein